MDFRALRKRIISNYLVSGISIILVLFILGSILLLIFNAKLLSRKAQENIVLILILKNNTPEDEIVKFTEKLKKEPFTKAVKYTPKDEALDQLKMELGENIDEILDYNPLPPSVDLKLKRQYANSDSIYVIRNKILQDPLVEDVYYNKSVVNQLSKNIKVLTLFLSVLSLLMILITIVLITNTVHLSIYSQRMEIKTMQLVGASWFFILRPFARNGLLHGIFASLTAIALMVGVIWYVQSKSQFIFTISYLPQVFVLVFVTGTLITFISTVLTVLFFLRKPIFELY